MNNIFTKHKKQWIIGISIFLILILVAGIGVGNYFVNYALSPTSNSDERNIDEKSAIVVDEVHAKMIKENKALEDAKGEAFEATTQSASITSKDGLTLQGKYRDGNNSDIWVIIVHGYKSSNSNMMSFGAEFYNRGYNVLLPSNRAHGDSQGKYIGMGWLDKDDIHKWIDWIASKNQNAKIIMHGVSMGGATTLMLSGDNDPRVIGYIEDAGYTSAWDIFSSELDKRFSLPPFPVLHIANMVANVKAGYDLKEASALEQLKKCQKPVLFIHSNQDDFVPADMAHTLYNAASCEKDMYITEFGAHAESKDYNPTEYWNRIFKFIDEKIL